MAENQVDGGSVEGTATNANGGASGNQSVQQPSFDAAKLQSTLDALNDGFKTLEARVNGLQSVKDKDKQELSGLKQKIAEYEQLKEKLGPEGALDQMELKQTLAEIKAQLSNSVSTQATGTSASGVVNAAQAVRDAGLDTNDPQVALLASKPYGSEAELNAAIVSHLKAQRNSPSPTQAQALTDTGSAPKDESVQEKTDKYINDMQAARGNSREIKRLRDQAIKDGVPIWEIDFS